MLRDCTVKELQVLLSRYPALEPLSDNLYKSVELITESIANGGKILVCGNGGSASDSLHIVGELMKSFVLKRNISDDLRDKIVRLYPDEAEYYINNLQGAIPAISLVNEVALITAFGNDQSSELAFAQQVLGYGKPGDVLIAISTSGNSANVLHAARIARIMGVHVISLTGQGGGKLKDLSDVLLNVPSNITYQIQEYHLPVYHALCLALEQEFYG